jgi:exosome complex component RRP46
MAANMAAAPAAAPSRRALNLRPMESEQALLNRADGSARFAQGATAVLVGVHGPVAAPARSELIDRAALEVVFTPLNGSGSRDAEVQQAALLRAALECVVLTTLHPRTRISVVVQVLHDDGSLLACALNAAMLALLDAGVQCRAMLSACCVSVARDGALSLDPNAHAEAQSAALVTVAAESATGKLALCETLGVLSAEAFGAAVELGLAACPSALAYIKLAAQRALERNATLRR